MQLHFKGDLTHIKEGVEILSGVLGISISEQGMPIKVLHTEENIVHVSCKQGEGLIRYSQRAHFFRALGLFIQMKREQEEFEVTETPQFKTNGGMIDCSRNSVMKPASVKQLIERLALMGLNVLMLYTEDTYTIEDEPLFGYMRGRYSEQELKDLDDYADLFGVELIPCIQTLAHLSTFLRWNTHRDLRDTSDVLLANSEQTYQFIDKMIESAAKPFRSNRIHIGMDEAHGLGQGRYLELYGYHNRFDIMSEHLRRVHEITTKYHLKPMIWSDMYFRLGSKDNEYYDLESQIPPEAVEKHGSDIDLVYWDYYHQEAAFYEQMLSMHRKFTANTIFAGAVWTFSGLTTHYYKTFKTTEAALMACKKQGIEEVFTTVWLDDGAENHYFSALLGFQLYAEHGFSAEPVNSEKLKSRFEFCTGGNYDAFRSLSTLDMVPGASGDQFEPDNPAKMLLWQDLLLGLFDRHFENLQTSAHYRQCEEQFEQYAKQENEWAALFIVPWRLASVLAIKAELGLQITALYKNQQKTEMNRIVEDTLPALVERVNQLKSDHRKQWMAVNKPFGWEVMDVRYGGLLSRIDTVISRLKDWIDGDVTQLEELEQSKLYYDRYSPEKQTGVGRVNRYSKIITTNNL